MLRLFIVLLLSGIYGPLAAQESVIRVNKIVLVDAGGVERAVLGATSGGAFISMHGGQHINIKTDIAQGAAIQVLRNGLVQVEIVVGGESGGVVKTKDRNGDETVIISSEQSDGGRVETFLPGGAISGALP